MACNLCKINAFRPKFISKQVDITIFKNQALQILYLVLSLFIVYNGTVFNTVLNRNIPQLSLVTYTRKVIVENISRIRYQGPYSNAYNIVLNLERLYSLVPFSSLVLLLFYKLLIIRSRLSTA